jgi:nitrogen fixation protein NifU and related proteins
MSVYNTVVMEHFRNPRNHRRLATYDFTTGDQNPSCGDSIVIDGCVADGKVIALGFDSHGCAINQASASLVTEAVIGKSVDEVLALDKQFVLGLLGIELGPNRIKCALLGLMALQQGLTEYKKKGVV